MLALTACLFSWFCLRSAAAPPSVWSLWFPASAAAVFGRQSLWLWFLSSSVVLAGEAQLLLFSQMSAYPQLPSTLTESAVSTRTWARHWSWFNVKIDHDLQVVHRQLLTCLTNTGVWAAFTKWVILLGDFRERRGAGGSAVTGQAWLVFPRQRYPALWTTEENDWQIGSQGVL